MAHSTQYVFDVTVADIDRNAYADLSLQVAQHPSETIPYMVTRVLAFALEHEEGVAFPPGGLSTADDPAVWVRDLTGALRAWIEVGTPDGRRLHKASKAADRVVVYCHKDPDAWLRGLESEKIYAPERVSIVLLERGFIEQLADKVDRRTTMSVTLTEGTLYIDIGGESLSAPIDRRPWPKVS
jgi:uncharacterized protein YaeQ